MICSRCGTENETGRFCHECGAPISAACPSCGTAVVPGHRFCGQCGTTLVDAPPTRATAVPAVATAERRLVSVLFADLVGFTQLSEGRDAEEVRELLSSYFDTCRTLITRYGG